MTFNHHSVPGSNNERQSLKDLLHQHALLANIDDAAMDRICSSCRIIQLTEGEKLFHQGDNADYFYYVVDGIIKLFRGSQQGHEKIVELQRSGGLFAEALICAEDAVYPVNAAALSKTSLVAISTRVFRQVLLESNETCLRLLSDLSYRLHQQVNEIERISLLSGRNRVAFFFLERYLRQGKSFTLEVPKSAIASILSVQPATFSRLIKELREEEILEIKEFDVKVLDPEALRQFAGIA